MGTAILCPTRTHATPKQIDSRKRQRCRGTPRGCPLCENKKPRKIRTSQNRGGQSEGQQQGDREGRPYNHNPSFTFTTNFCTNKADFLVDLGNLIPLTLVFYIIPVKLEISVFHMDRLRQSILRLACPAGQFVTHGLMSCECWLTYS